MAVDVGDEVKAFARDCETIQREHGHLRPQIRATDADVDDVSDGVVRPDLPGISQHGFQRFVHQAQFRCCFSRRMLWPMFRSGRWAAQQKMHDLAVFGGVDGFTGEQGVAVGFQPTIPGQRKQ